MAATILQVFINFLNLLAGHIFGPLFTLTDSLWDLIQLTPYLDRFNIFIQTYVAPFIAYFMDAIPPLSLSVIILELTVSLFIFNLSLAVHIGLKALKLMKKLPLA